MSSTQHQLIEQCATRLRGIVEALDNIHDTSPQRWSTDLDDVHSSAESLLAMIEGQAPALDAQDLARVADLEAKLADLEKQEPIGWFAQYCETPMRRMVQWGAKVPDCAADTFYPLYAAPVAQAQHGTGYAEARQCVNCRHIGINDAADYAACHDCNWTGPEPDEDKCPGCAGENCMAAACPECGGRYDLVAEANITAPAGQVPQAWLDVQAERRRQITAEGWTPEHDDAHSHGEMALAAASYAAYAHVELSGDLPMFWPWGRTWWKPTTPRRDLVKACALALAEIERLDRAAASQGGPSDA
ncbi:hypothetical protein ACM7OQ_13820 [Pseudomonas aeruginosa]|uniref:hypothetical protein n=1 Tax=Pseudomonas aeruginosa TaxID=287 RepID=UPI002A6A70F6|nr:hypothetical protein [Pseudomonas aeruginosa]MDY1243472.1 hypothetical protein [Pseudomonas aeruginosa]